MNSNGRFQRNFVSRTVVGRGHPPYRLPRCSRPASRRSRTQPNATPARAALAALRAELKRRGLDGFVVPRADRHQNEYVPPSEERLAWLTGFTGSAGAAIVLADRAAIFVDGRYTCRCAIRSTPPCSRSSTWSTTRPTNGWRRTCRRARRFGYDPWLHTADGAEKLAKACAAAGATLVPVEPNPIDASGPTARPAARRASRSHDQTFAGETRAGQARAHPGRDRKAQGRRAGRLRPAQCRLDLQHPRRGRRRIRRCRSPSRSCRARAGRRSISTAASSPTRRATTSKRSPTCASRAHSPTTSRRSAPRRRPCGSTRRPPRMRSRALIADAGGKVVRGADPITLMKAVKNATEIAGTRAAHVRDGAAVATSSPGSTARRRRASSPRSTRSRRSRPSGATPACSRTCRSRPSPAPGRTARSCTTASRARPTARSSPASCS